MAAVGDKNMAVRLQPRGDRPQQAEILRRALHMQTRRLRAEAVDLDGQRKGAERRDLLRFVGDDDEAPGRRGDDFFAQ